MKNLLLLSIIFLITPLLNAQWVQTNGTSNGAVGCLAASGTNLFAGTWQDFEQPSGGAFLSTNNGTSWTNIGFSDTIVVALAISGTNIFAGILGSGVFLTTNAGTSWTAVNTGLTATNVYSLVVSGTNIFAGTLGGIFLSTDNGTSWTAVNTGLTDTNVYSLVVSGTNIFAGTLGGVFLSTNNGTNWTAVNNGLTNITVRALEVSGTNLFAGTFGGGVFLSSNNGTSWTAVNSGLTNTYIWAFAVFETNLFVGTSGGVFLSTNNDTSWTAINDGLTGAGVVYALLVYNSYLFAGTDYQVWRRPLSEIITSAEQQEIRLPDNFILQQNYPNPFNPSTTIKYSIPTSEFVTLKIYDVLGNEVATLVNEEKPAGSYEVEYNAAKLSSGIYLYTLQAGSYTQTKKLILMK